jgi:SPP1 gp7 family putative phage head morphogenesis protein
VKGGDFQLPPGAGDLRKARKLARERFLAGRKAERQYAVRLKQVAKQIDNIVRGMAPEGVLTAETASRVAAVLNRYAEILKPWAESVAKRMIGDVSRRDAWAWEQHGKAIGQQLRREIANAPTGEAMRASLSNQVQLITSLPREAAERVHALTLEGIVDGTRAKEIAAEILRSGEVSKSRAELIARTEVSRTATALTKARAQFVGSEGYIWRTSKDGAVRPSHRAMEGKLVRWDTPPDLDTMIGHAGEFPNCRCFCEVVIAEKL